MYQATPVKNEKNQRVSAFKNVFPEKYDLEKLVIMAQNGNKEAENQLMRELRPIMFCMSMRLCGDEVEAEEIVQDTLLVMVKALANFRGSCVLTTWVYTIVKSCWLKRKRKSKFAPNTLLSLENIYPAELLDPCQQPDAIAASREIWSYVQDAMLALRPSERELLLMREREGMRTNEISETLQISISAVKSRLHRARMDLRGHLANGCFNHL